MRPVQHLRSGRPKLPPWHLGALVILSLYCLWALFPMVWVFYSSAKTDRAIFEEPFRPPMSVEELAPENYSRTWDEAHFNSYFLNSVVVVGFSLAGILILGSMTAYALGRFLHRLRALLFWVFLAGLMLPVQLSIVPLFFLMRDWGLLNSRTGLILVYIANGLPFAIFVLSAYFRGLPKALHEAAIVDGCSEFRAFFSIMLPLSTPALATVAIFQFLFLWKEFFFAFMFLSGASGAGATTLPLGLAGLAVASQYQTDYGMLFSGLAIVTLPMLIAYLFLQPYLIRGIGAGAMKG